MIMFMMFRSPLVTITLVVVLVSLAWQTTRAAEQEIFLPPDCDAVTINGEGFQLRFEEIKRDWKRVEAESSRVDVPRPQPSDDDQSEGGGGQNPAEEEEESVVTNEKLYEEAQGAGELAAMKDYGFLDDDLLEWIGARATSLMSKIERYNKESLLVRGANKVAINIMLLNILVDLDNLNKEEIPKLKWVKNKLKKLLKEYIHEAANAGEVLEYTRTLIDTNKALELKVRGTNDPGKAWITNTQALRRILHEQRYSADLGKLIVDYLAGPFNMMKRSAVFQINQRPKTLDDGMYYVFSRDRVPRTFPFAAQDAISHGEY